MKIITNGGLISGLRFVNWWSGNNGRWQTDLVSSANHLPGEGRGVWVSPGSGRILSVEFVNFSTTINRREGVRIEGGSNLFFSNIAFESNSYLTSSPSLNGFYAENSSKITINGGGSYCDTVKWGPATQNYGIYIGSGCDYYTVTSTMNFNNISGGVLDAGGSNKYLVGNFS
jgi:hypothetical protein